MQIEPSVRPASPGAIARTIRRGQGGFALASVMFLGAVMILLTAVIIMRSSAQSEVEFNDGQWEQSLHVAEGGMDDYLADLALASDPDAVNTGHTASQFGNRAAIISEADALAESEPTAVLSAPEGEYVILKPSDDDVIYSVGFTPNRLADGRKVRVVEIDYEYGVVGVTTPNWGSQYAILAGGDLSLGGALAVDVDPSAGAPQADVHANGSLSIGGAATVSGCGSESVDSGYTPDPGCPASPVVVPDMPIVDARSGHYLSEYDLCPDGQARLGPAYSGSDPGTKALAGSPCTGTATPWPTGWSPSGSDWDINGKADGVFYVYGGDVGGKPGVSSGPSSGRGPATATVFIEKAYTSFPPIDGDEVLPVCGSGTGGNIHLNGGALLDYNSAAVIDGSNSGVVVVAEGQVHFNGNADINGLVFAREDFAQGSGNSSLTGALVVMDSCGIGTDIVGTLDLNYTGPISTTFDYEDTTTTGTGVIEILGRSEA